MLRHMAWPDSGKPKSALNTGPLVESWGGEIENHQTYTQKRPKEKQEQKDC